MKWIEKPEASEWKAPGSSTNVRSCWYRICNKCDGNQCKCNTVAIG